MTQNTKLLSIAFSCMILTACGGSGDSSSGGGSSDPVRFALSCLSTQTYNGRSFPIRNTCDAPINVRIGSGKIIKLNANQSASYAYTFTSANKTVYIGACKVAYTPVFVNERAFTCE